MSRGVLKGRNSAMMAYFRRPVDIASLVVFRFFAGILLSMELLYSLSLGDLKEYSHAGYHFHYQWFEWLRPFGEMGMKLLYAATITAGFFVAIGLFYRVMSAVLFAGYLCLFLMEASQYVNHLYLYCLITFWMMLLPLHRNGSVDAKLFSTERSNHLPLWCLQLFQVQIGLVYFYAGVAKLHPDWLSGRMMNLFLSARGIHAQNLGEAMAIGGLLFDLFIIPALLWKRTRVPAFLIAVLFHLSNVVMFGLGSFPWFALMSLTLFFPPQWPRTFSFIRKYFGDGQFATATSRITPFFLSAYIVVQILLPLRHHLYPHDAGWSEEGHNYSWRMKTRIKRGNVTYKVRDIDTGYTWVIDPSVYLTETQTKDLGGNPEFIRQFAHFLRSEFKKWGWEVEVFANARASLNKRPYQLLVDPARDLSREKSDLYAYDWIMKQDASSVYTAGAGYKVFRSGRREFQHSAQSDAAPEAQAQLR